MGLNVESGAGEVGVVDVGVNCGESVVEVGTEITGAVVGSGEEGCILREMAVFTETGVAALMAGITGFIVGIVKTTTGTASGVVIFPVETIVAIGTVDGGGVFEITVMESANTRAVVAVLAEGNILGLGRVAGDVGVPCIASGFVADGTVGCRSG